MISIRCLLVTLGEAPEHDMHLLPACAERLSESSLLTQQLE